MSVAEDEYVFIEELAVPYSDSRHKKGKDNKIHSDSSFDASSQSSKTMFLEKSQLDSAENDTFDAQS